MFLELTVIAVGLIASYLLTAQEILSLDFDFMNTGVIHPDFLLIFVIFFALYRGEFAGLWIGFFAGLLEDSSLWAINSAGEYVHILGIHASVYTLTGFALGKMNRIFDRYQMAPLILMVLGTTLIAHFLAWTLHGVLQEFHQSVSLLGQALYTAIVSPIVFALLSWLYRIRPGDGA